MNITSLSPPYIEVLFGLQCIYYFLKVMLQTPSILGIQRQGLKGVYGGEKALLQSFFAQ